MCGIKFLKKLAMRSSFRIRIRLWFAIAILLIIFIFNFNVKSLWYRVESPTTSGISGSPTYHRTVQTAWKAKEFRQIRFRMGILKQTFARLAKMSKKHISLNSEGHFLRINANNSTSSIKDCSDYERQTRMSRTIMTNIWQDSTSYDTDEVALVTQTSQNRMDRIERLLNHWPGPVSVAICVDLADQETFFRKILSCPSAFWRQNLDLHMVVKEEGYYPTNLMRNVALNNTRAAFVLLLDVDLVPSYNTYDVMKMASQTLRGKKALIPAAFEFVQQSNQTVYPWNKTELIRLWDKGQLRQFRAAFPPGQRPTNYQKWRKATKQYVVQYNNFYEPYMMLPHNITPPFDQRFIGRYFNKDVHTRHVNFLGFELNVSPDIFLVHYPHVEVVRDKNNLKCAMRAFHDFKKNLKRSGKRPH